MINNSRFILESVLVDDLRVILTGTIVCHKNELIFQFRDFSVKMAFLTDETKNKDGEFVLDSKVIPATLNCYNFNSEADSTLKPFKLAKYISPQVETLYIAFSIIANGEGKIIHYTFYSKLSLQIIGN